jgi:hypothetical protein
MSGWSQIGGDVLAGAAVAARGALNQHAVFIADVGRQAVDLGFGDEGDRVCMRQFQEALDAGHEVGDVAFVEGVVQRQHRHAVAHFGELAGGRRAHLCEGESGRIRAGKRISISRLRAFRASYSASVSSGAASL